MNRAELKANAKRSLQGKYGQAILMTIIFSFITSMVTYVVLLGGPNASKITVMILEYVAIILRLSVFAFLTLGSVSFYLKVSRNEEVTWKELFSKTNLWLGLLGVTIVTGVFISLWSLLIVIPGIIASYRYAMVDYILLDNPNIGIMDCINKSKKMMYGHKMDLFLLHLSFIGWVILGVFTLGILYLWLMPYMSVTIANFYNSIKDQN